MSSAKSCASLPLRTASSFMCTVSHYLRAAFDVWQYWMKFVSFHGSTSVVHLGLLYEVSRSVRHIKLDRTPLDEWSAYRRGLYLTTHNTHKRQTSMPPARFEPTIPASERPQTHALDSAATLKLLCACQNTFNLFQQLVVDSLKKKCQTRKRLRTKYENNLILCVPKLFFNFLHL
jgi:hypothetical protein